jgi:hypothetical protein
LLSPATGVGQQPRRVGVGVVLPVSEDEQPLAPVGRADLRRRKEACRKPVANADQSAGDFGKSEAQMMRDILQEDEGRFDLVDDARDMRPEMARVRGAEPPAGDGKRLARIARQQDVHRAAPRAAVECSNVVPDSRAIQGRVFHPRHENGRGVGFPLDVTQSAISGTGEEDPEVESAGAGAEREPEQASASAPRSASGGM